MGNINKLTKVCKTCKIEQSTDAFYKHKQTKDRLRPECKPCWLQGCAERYKKNPDKALAQNYAWREKNYDKWKAKTKEWYETNKEQIIARGDVWRSKNPERVRAYKDAWAKANPERVKAKNAAWYKENLERAKANHAAWRKANAERFKELQAAWRRNNPEAMRKYSELRKAQQLIATPKWLTNEMRQEIRDIYAKVKQLNKERGGEYYWTVDHIIPLLNRNVCGLHIPTNLRIISKSENSAKGNKLINIDNINETCDNITKLEFKEKQK
jgi:hypothetical protein